MVIGIDIPYVKPIIARVSHGLTIKPIIIEPIINRVRYRLSFFIGIFLIEIVGTLLAIKTARTDM